MNKENMNKWIEALRSGTYKQGNMYLHMCTEDGVHKYCCLGVACEVAIENGVEISTRLRNHLVSGGTQKIYDEETSTLPDSVVEWLGLAYRGGEYLIDHLITMNDGERKSFS